MGRTAAELLFDRIGGSTRPPEVRLVPTTLIRRGSGEIPPPWSDGRTCVRLEGWAGTTRTSRGASWRRCSPGARTAARLSGGPEADGGDSPAWSRKREPLRRRRSWTSRASACPTPSCTATPTSASSTARATPRSWSSRPRGSGWRRSRSPTTTACTAWSGSPRRPPSWSVATVFGAELSLGLSAPQNGVADPEGSHLLLLARDPEGYRGALPRDQRRPAARRGEGPPGLRPRRGGRATPRARCWP